MNLQKTNKDTQQKALTKTKQFLTNVCMNIHDSSIILLIFVTVLSNNFNHLFYLIDIFMNSFYVFSFIVEDQLLFYMITIDINVLVFICLLEEKTYSIFDGETKLKVIAKIDDFGYSIHKDIFFWLEFIIEIREAIF